MMKKLLILFFTLAFTSVTYAEKVTEQQALQKAQQFFKDKGIVSANPRRAKKVEQQSDATQEDFYVFNAENNGGFVIISGDDRTEEILGYADSGSLDMDNLPSNLKGWLEGYSKQIDVIRQENYSGQTTARRAPSTPRAAIEPLIITKWGQDGPYNLMCPEIDGKHCVTGCVATAMAQVMYYHKWPQDACAAIPAYTTATRQIQMDALPPTAFKWDKMRDRYWDGETGESADAVAQLMRYCGQAVTMNYNIDESGSGVVIPNLINYFGYSKNVKHIQLSQYTMSQWEDILYKELSEGRPILYEGFATFSGHEFICDGYDKDGYFHFNWGWNGMVDGFFLLSLFRNEDVIFGAFVEQQSAIIGLEPEKGETAIPYVYGFNGGELTKTNYSRTSASEDFSNIILNGGIFIQYEVDVTQDVTLDYGLGLYQGDQLLSVLKQSTATLNLDNKAIANEMTLSFGSNLSDGSYQIRHIYKYPDGETWQTCYDAYLNYIVATISGTTVTLRNAIGSDAQNADYIVNDVSFSGKLFTMVTVNITNTGDTNQEMLYLCIRSGGDIVNCSMVCGDIAPGETGDIVFPVTLTYYQGGDIPMLISTKCGGQNVKWEEVVNIPKPLSHVTCTNYSIKNLEGGILKDSKLQLTFTVTNDGDDIYDDRMMYGLHEWYDGRGVSIWQILQNVTLNKGESKTLEIVIPNLKNNLRYSLDVTFSTGNVITQMEFYVAAHTCSQNGLNYAYEPSTKTASIISGNYQQLSSVSIPSSISVDGQSYKVIEIASKTFIGCNFQSIILPEGLLAIGSGAFQSCDIQSITLPSTLKCIGQQAFYCCSGLKEIVVPEGVSTIKYGAFEFCKDLEVLRLPSTLNLIDECVVWGSEKLTAVYSAKSDPITIPERAFITAVSNSNNGQITQVPQKATLYVPKGSVSKYQEAVGWNVFTRITDKDVYKLIYQVDGAEYKTIYVVEGDAITPESSPEAKDTYQFSGWSEIPETMPAHDVIVTGTFERHFDVGHVVNVVNYIMGNNATPEDIALYDMNNDNELNIGDIILIVKNILNNGSAAARLAYRRAADRIDFAQYTAAQFELKVDKNASIKDIRLVGSMSQSHQLMCQQKDDNTYVVVVYSLTNQLMKPENGRIVDVEAEDGNVMMQNITVATQTGEMHYYQDYGMPTDIHQLEKDGNSAVIYDLKGNRLNGVSGQRKGVYIINGKKVVVR